MTIFFEEDFMKQGAYLHPTKNVSFLKMRYRLEEMGIKNKRFFLSIYDKDLIGHDPHNLTDNSLELRQRIALEIRQNVWYYLREIVRVPVTGSDSMPFILNRGNLAMSFCFMNNIDYFGVQPRQSFKTISAMALSAYIIYFYGYNIPMVMLTKDTDLLHENVIRLKTIRDAFPKYLIDLAVNDEDNKEGLSYKALSNRYSTAVGRGDHAGADTLGRGLTTPVIHIDEIAFVRMIMVTFQAMMNSQIAARRNAKLNGQPHSNIYTTTAGRTDEPSGAFAFRIMNDGMPFTERLYDCKNHEEMVQLIKMNSIDGSVSGTFSYLQLGYTHAWFVEQAARSKGKQDEIDRDLLCMWKSGTSEGLLSDVALKKLNETQRDPDHVEILGDYVISWYVSERIRMSEAFCNRPFILGMDSSEQTGRDFTALVLIDPADMSVAATFRCNESNILKLAMFIGEFLIKYRKTLWVPERKSTGPAIIDAVVPMLISAGHNPFFRIFNKVIQERHDAKMSTVTVNNPEILIDSGIRRHLGFMTTGQTRAFLYKTVLQKAVNSNAHLIHDKTLTSELSGLSTIDGRIDHKSGAHDDLVIAYLLACYTVYFGKNLDYYGIPTSYILSSSQSVDINGVQTAYRQQQLELRKMIKRYQNLIEACESPLLKDNYRQKLVALQDAVDEDIRLEPVSSDKVMNDLSEYGNVYTNNQMPSQPLITSQNTIQGINTVFNFDWNKAGFNLGSSTNVPWAP